MKRYRSPALKPGMLRIYYGKTDRYEAPDVCYQWGGAGASKCDSHLLYGAFSCKRLELVYGDERLREGAPYKFGPSLLEELEARGYDLTTIKFSIELKKRTAQGE
jgi:hypothetical protein